MTSKIDSADLSKLNDQDREDLRRFLEGENQRSHIQTTTHTLTEMCWKKCITGAVKSQSLDRTEETCMTNCVQRFLDINFLTMKHLENMRK
ncbi:hypothetical protein TD95_000381 [Thielaviopsis punctulata]|uniref:Mitochondrial import inner membrane translocase subunit n=1 Tax=Thielaviopsis punctulata TaxID=72032 RepID=A0A0F4Z9K9_9PEZI|nr:hypothetical protein TD95_000381 [Thielaviopsis punctulata]